MKCTILHIISTLSTGGAEMMLYKLLSCMNRTDFEARVISLTDIGAVGKKIQTLGVPVRALSMQRGIPNPLALIKLANWLRHDRPHIIQTWMYHADLIGGLAAKLVGSIPVVWGIRQSNLSLDGNKRSTIWTAKVNARLSSRLPVMIVCGSEASRRVHTELGYASANMAVIHNGVDTKLFKPDISARMAVRKELGIPEDANVIGLVGRFDPQKDHHNFIQAAALLHVSMPDVHFLLCGKGITWENKQLAAWIETSRIPADRFHLLGLRDDIPQLIPAVDILSSSSYGEGFPNVIIEAMACAVPCVVTDVGDSAMIVEETGKVVSPKNSAALADGWKTLIEAGNETRHRLGQAARQRVIENFSLERITVQYEQLYHDLLRGKR
ncbi:MAG: glycosyltransferase family 4 protein [Thermodesulfobacteriota bacterium]